MCNSPREHTRRAESARITALFFIALAAAGSVVAFSTASMAHGLQVAASATASEIAAGSELGYVVSFHDPWEGYPGLAKCTAVCRNGVVSGAVRLASSDGKIFLSVRRQVSLDAYLELWRALEANRAMALESPMEILMRSKTEAEGPYIRYETSHDWHRFAFRIGDRQHMCKVYAVGLLKDLRYPAVLEALDGFFEIILGSKIEAWSRWRSPQTAMSTFIVRDDPPAP